MGLMIIVSGSYPLSSKRFICCLSRLEVREGYVLKMFGTCMVRAFWELTITKHYNVGSLKLEPTVRLVYLGMLLEDENLGQLQMMGNSVWLSGPEISSVGCAWQ